MQGLIDRQAAIDAVEKWFFDTTDLRQPKEVLWCVPSAQPENKELSAWQEDFRGYIKMLNLPNDDYKGIMEYINDAPPAQSIIHCGTCKWFQCNMRPDGYLPKGVDEFECRHWCGPCDPVDFCSRAESREE